MKKKYAKLYMIVWNLGGNLHNEVYTLYPKPSEYEEGYDYWDKTGNYGFATEDNIILGLNKQSGCWRYITNNQKDSWKIFLGARITKLFFQELIK